MKAIVVPYRIDQHGVSTPLRELFDLDAPNMDSRALNLFQRYFNPDQDPDYWSQEPAIRDLDSRDFSIGADGDYLFFTILDSP